MDYNNHKKLLKSQIKGELYKTKFSELYFVSIIAVVFIFLKLIPVLNLTYSQSSLVFNFWDLINTFSFS